MRVGVVWGSGYGVVMRTGMVGGCGRVVGVCGRVMGKWVW